MTKKDYELIAEEIRWLNSNDLENCCYNLLFTLVQNLTESLGKENPQFDSEIFLSACGF